MICNLKNNILIEPGRAVTGDMGREEYQLFRVLLGRKEIHPVCDGVAAEIIFLDAAQLGRVDIKHKRFWIAQLVFGP